MRRQSFAFLIALLLLLVLSLGFYLYVAQDELSPLADHDASAVGDEIPMARRQELSPEPRRVEDSIVAETESPSSHESFLTIRVRGAAETAWQLDYVALGSLSIEDKTRVLIVETDFRELLDQRAETLEAASGSESLQLPKLGEGYFLRASAAGRLSRVREVEFDWNQISGGVESIELELESFAEIEVLVLDHQGRPAAAVPLMERRIEEGAGVLATFRSGDDGLARLRVPLASASEDERRQRIIAFAGPHEPRVSIPVPAPGQRATLKLPPTGTLIFRLLDESQRPLDEIVGGTLWNNSDDPTPGPSFNWSRESRDGYLRYDWVGLGVDLGLGARPLDGGREPISIFFPGPSSPGEVLHLDMNFKELLPAVSGRLVDHQGQALAGASLVIAARSLDDDQDWGAGEVVMTNSEGDFRQALGWLECSRPYQLEIIASMKEGRVLGFDAPRAQVRCNQGLSPGMNDLGILLCLAPLPLARGRLLDPKGEPLRGQKIELMVTREPSSYQRFSKRPIVVETDIDGEFEFRSVEMLPFKLRLWGETLPLTEEILGGATDLTLIRR